MYRCTIAVRCTSYKVRCTYDVELLCSTRYLVPCTLYLVHSTLYDVHSTSYKVHVIRYIIVYTCVRTLYSYDVRCTLYIVPCTRYIVHSTSNIVAPTTCSSTMDLYRTYNIYTGTICSISYYVHRATL